MNEIILKFNKFLIDNNALLAYLKNVKEEISNRGKYGMAPSCFIIDAFIWNFNDLIHWSSLHNKWGSKIGGSSSVICHNYITLECLYRKLLELNKMNTISIF